MHDFSILLSQIQSPPAVLTLYAWILRNHGMYVPLEVEEEGTHQFAGSAAEEEKTTLQLQLL